jgi:Xaa-Pro aminopeptidase
MEDRLARLRAKLEAHGLGGVFISAPAEDTSKTVGANRRYLSGFTGSMGHLLITPEVALIAVDFRYYEQAEKESPHFQMFKANGPMTAWLAAFIREANLGGQKLGFEAQGVSYATYQSLRKAIAELPEGERPELKPTTNLVESLRVIKEPGEIEALQAAVTLGDQAFEYVAEMIEPGFTEKRVAWEIEKYVREHGGEGLSFETIVGAGPWGAMPHAHPRDYAIQRGEGVVIDMGVKLDNGYVSDLTRTIFMGKADDEFRKIYDIVLGAQLTAEELVRPGMTGGECHALAAKVIEEAGYGDKFGHGLGHGVGLQVHEPPRVGPNSEDKLEDGMVFTIEPGIYLPAWGGVRIEDQGYLKDGHYVPMSHATKLKFTS